MVMDVDYRRLSPSSRQWPLWLSQEARPCSGELRVEKHDNGWNYCELSVPASKDLADLWEDGWRYARLYVGAPNGDGRGGDATVYVDDIRFYPVGSMVKSFYYKGKSTKPETCVGPDNTVVDCIAKDGD
jgi:hypothetical protein